MTLHEVAARARRWVRDAVPTVVMLGLLLAARSSLADQYMVPSGSMEATLQVGDRIAVDKRAYGWRVPFTDVMVAAGDAPAVGEVVIFDSPVDGTRLVKRVVAVGGDVVAVAGGRVWRNGEFLAEPYRDLGAGGGPELAPVRVPAGALLVLGDNRGESFDGRSFGWVRAAAVYGRVLGVFWRGGGPAWREVGSSG